jgi:alpha-ketoglutarate-dependent taurine dioxygenase
MTTTTETNNTKFNNESQSIKIINDIPIDLQIEDLVRKHNELNITRSRDENLKFEGGGDKLGLALLPESSRKRLEDAGLDLSSGYPEVPERDQIPIFVDQAYAIRDYDFPYIERGANADPEKRALLSAATEVINLTKHVGTEIVGLQLEDLTDQQKDELALLIAERVVVFFRDQKLSPKTQRSLGEYYGNVEVHPQVPHVTGLPGATVIWNDYIIKKGIKLNFSNSNFANWDSNKYLGLGNQGWHTDLVHERQPAGYTHLHLDAIPSVGGDTIWSSGYAAYDKLSTEFKKFLDGKKAVYISAHGYLDRKDPLGGPKRVERVHPLVRTHPATGWKYLFVNRGMTRRILGVSPIESDVILNYLFDVYEKNADIQARFKWTNTKEGYGTSAIWDNRVSQHRNVWDHEGAEPRHGTRVTSLAEKPYFDPNSKSQRESLGLPIHEWE